MIVHRTWHRTLSKSLYLDLVHHVVQRIGLKTLTRDQLNDQILKSNLQHSY